MRAGGAAFLAEMSNPFRMSRGQCTLVIEEWLAWNASRQPKTSPGGDTPSTPSTLGMRDSAVPAVALRAAPTAINTDFDVGRGATASGAAESRLAATEQDQFGAWATEPLERPGEEGDDPFGVWIQPPLAAWREETPATRTVLNNSGEAPRSVEGAQQRLDRCAPESAEARRVAEESRSEMTRIKAGLQRLVQVMDEQMEAQKDQVLVLEAENASLRQRVGELETKAQEFEASDWGPWLQQCYAGVFAAHGVVSQLTS
jgi:BMFP domain-containing protein YqiC